MPPSSPLAVRGVMRAAEPYRRRRLPLHVRAQRAAGYFLAGVAISAVAAYDRLTGR